ncbi:MAG: diacylglycerol kinase family protein [Chitinophagales bacterium]
MAMTIMKFINGFFYALKGLGVASKEQLNLKIHLLALVVVIVAGIFFDLVAIEWAVIFLTFGLVIATEMVNTAIEYLVDMVQPEFHPQAGKVKDVAAGAVLVAAIIAVAVAITIFGNKFFNEIL